MEICMRKMGDGSGRMEYNPAKGAGFSHGIHWMWDQGLYRL